MVFNDSKIAEENRQDLRGAYNHVEVDANQTLFIGIFENKNGLFSDSCPKLVAENIFDIGIPDIDPIDL